MNDADKELHEIYMKNRDELSDEYLRDLVWDIWKEMEERKVRPSNFTEEYDNE